MNASLVPASDHSRQLPRYQVSVGGPRPIGVVSRTGSLPSCYRWWFIATEWFREDYRKQTGDTWPALRSCRTRAEVLALATELLEESSWRPE